MTLIHHFHKLAIIVLASLSVVLLSPTMVRAATADPHDCSCTEVWAGSFSGEEEALGSIKTRNGGREDFCTIDVTSCRSFCIQMRDKFEGAVSEPSDIPDIPALPPEDCVSSIVDPTDTGSGVGAGKTIKLVNPLGTENVPQLIGNIISAVLGITGAVALLMFIYGGLLWLTSGGAADKVTKGKEVMVWAAIGLIVIFSSYGLVRFVFGAFS